MRERKLEKLWEKYWLLEKKFMFTKNRKKLLKYKKLTENLEKIAIRREP